MSSVHPLREFISERLTAAAAEIFSEFEQTILRYEEELDRQRRLLDLCWNPEVKLHRVDLQQEPVHKTRTLKDQQLCKQERNSSLDQVEPEPPQFEDQEEPEPPQFEDQEEPEPPQFEDQKEPEPPPFEDQKEPEPPQFEDQKEPEPPPFEDQKEPEPPPFEDQKDSLAQLLWIKEEPDQPEPPEIKAEEAELCTNQEEDQVHLNLVTTLHEDLSDPEPDRKQLISQSSAGPEDQDQDQGSGSNEKTDHRQGCHGNQADRSATSERFSCEICGETFLEKLLLIRHIKVHKVWNQNSDKLLYCCPTCGKTFPAYSKFVMHMRIHTGEKPFSCRHCGKKFTSSGDCRRHMRIHTGEKPFSCRYCEKKFTSSWQRKQHVMTHSGEKPFVCETCGKSYNRNFTLKSHMKMHRD